MKSPRIEVTYTVTIKLHADIDSYQGMTAEEALEYERDLPMPERVQAIAEALSYMDESDIDLGTTVKLID